MNRRSFLLGASSLVAAAAAPLPSTFKQGGTITGRYTSGAPGWHELPRSEVKSWLYARQYGAGAAKLQSMSEHMSSLSQIDISKIEARVFALSHDALDRGEDPFRVAFAT